MARPRTWTDEDLFTAVRTSITWNEVRTKLSANRRSVQGHAVRLGLDITHLPAVATTVRPIHPDDTEGLIQSLPAAVAAAVSWNDLMRRLDVVPNSRRARRIKDVVRSKGLSVAHFDPHQRKTRPASVIPFRPDRTGQTDLCRAAVALAMEWFLSRGYMVSVPVDAAPYDLVTDSDDGLKRVQVKTTSSELSRGFHKVRITRHRYGPRPGFASYNQRRAYTDEDIDLFFICTSSGAKYLIPLADTGGQQSIVLDGRFAAYRIE